VLTSVRHDQALEGSVSGSPRLVIVGGPNGAGKTTLARRLVVEYGLLYLGADEIAAEMGLGATGAGPVQAGRTFIERVNAAIERRESAIVESTLSGLGSGRLIRRFRGAGYEVIIEQVYVASAEECVARIRGRVLRGGHHVPEQDVRRRFTRSIRNFWERYRLEVDRWRLHYNGMAGPVLVIEGQGREALVIDPRLFERFLALLEE